MKSTIHIEVLAGDEKHKFELFAFAIEKYEQLVALGKNPVMNMVTTKRIMPE